MLNELIGRKVILHANEFIARDTTATIILIDENAQKLLLKLTDPLLILNIEYFNAVASPRLSRDNLDTLKEGRLGCAVTWLPDNKINVENPFDLNWWRGGAAAITDIYLKPSSK